MPRQPNRRYSALREICAVIGDTESKRMVEVGCFRGCSTKLWAKKFCHVYAVDMWRGGYDEIDEISIAVSPEVERTFDRHLQPYDNVSKLRMPSVEAARMFRPHFVDFVYLDGCHRYDAIQSDIRSWLPIVRTDGWIGGHDFLRSGFPGLTYCVFEHFGMPLVFHDSSWLVRKP